MPRIQVGDVQLYYEERGEGTPLLWISGTAMSGEHWNLSQVPFFASRYRNIVFDHRGTGRSDRPDAPYSTRQFARDAVGLLDALGVREPAHVVGHSMGGRVGQWIALDSPGRLRTLVLAASGSGQVDTSRPYTRGVPLETAESLALHGFDGYMERHMTGRFWWVDPSPDLVRRFMEANVGDRGTDLHSYLRHVIARQEHETTALLGHIEAPVLVIDGDQDTLSGGSGSHVDSSRYLAEHLPHTEMVLVPGAAHGFLYERAEATNEAIAAFLAAH